MLPPLSLGGKVQQAKQTMKMMFIQLAKGNIQSIIPKPFFIAHHPLLNRFCSESATKPPHFKVVNYLINSCGLSPEKAPRISKPISHLKSPEKPEAILGFLKQQGFTESDIQTLVTLQPKLLCSSGKALDTNLRALRNIGLSNSTLTQIILSGPIALRSSSAVPRIKFWINFLGCSETTLVKAFKCNRGLVGHDIDRTITPKLSLLERQGFSTQDVRGIVINIPQFITSNPYSMMDMLERTKELGFQPKSKMFVHGLRAMATVSKEVFQRKMELLKSFGLSEDEFLSALHRAPGMVLLSENNLQAKMEFFMREIKFKPSHIATTPVLLQLSLQKRLRPRHHVLHLLETKGLLDKRWNICTAFRVSENNFVERYILPHKEEIPGLSEAYLTKGV